MAINLKQIFERPIDRNIQPVISAGNNDDLRTEFEEYVVTSEIDSCLDNLFTYYNEPRPAFNGVWISGFFGSGKSHLLKIISNLLENRDIGGRSCLSFFEKNPSCSPLLLGSMRKACSIKSESILFNIIQESVVDKNGKSDSILPTFIRQFNRHCGYYDKDPVISELERELDDKDMLNDFISEFEKLSGQKWLSARQSKAFHRKSIIAAFAKITNQDEDPRLLDSFSSSHSIKDFANMVASYINKKGGLFRLNFFVDEAGQFVVKDSRFMVELQEIATSLSDATNNRAWVFVTSQDELDKFVAGFGANIIPDDVSKIMGRFYVKLKLTNVNVNEVIQKRLLVKNSDGMQITKAVYAAQKANFNTLFQFVNGPKSFRVFRDEEEFSVSYPFVTYQFDLFTVAFTALSNHHAFPGEYTSVGSRSMLDVFHQVALGLAAKDIEVGNGIVPFDAFYEGISNILMENFKSSINLAVNNMPSDPFAIRVLKAMLLVKYIRNDFKSTVHNLSVLLLSSFDENPEDIRQKVQNALNKLEAQTYIQRKGDEYEFLTNEEKDVEEEIKQEDATESNIRDHIQKTVFTRILPNCPKLKSQNGRFSFNYSKLVDGNLFGNKYDIGVNIVSPFDGDPRTAPIRYAGSPNLIVLLDDNGKLISDIRLYLQTESYYKKNVGGSMPEDRKKVLAEKHEFNIQRSKQIQDDIESCLRDATFFVRGSEITIAKGSPDQRFAAAGQQFIDKIYTNLTMLGDKTYNDAKVGEAFSEDISDFSFLSEPENQILSVLSNNKSRGIISTPQTLFEKFIAIPFGWDKMAILYYLVILKRKGKLEIKLNGKELSESEVKSMILKTDNHSRLALDVVTDVDPARKKKLKSVVEEISDKSCTSEDPKGIVEELKHALSEFSTKMSSYDKFTYPFIKVFGRASQIIKDCSENGYSWFYNNFLDNYAQELLDEMDDNVKPCLEFLATDSRRTKYEDAKKLLSENEKKEENRNLWEPIKQIVDDPNVFRSIEVAKLPSLCTAFKIALSNEMIEERNKAKAEFANYESAVVNSSKFTAITDEGKKEEIRILMNSFKSKYDEAQSKSEISYIQCYDLQEHKNAVNLLISSATPTPPTPPKPVKKLSSFGSISFPGDIETLQDVDAFIERLKAEMVEAINSGNKIQG